MSDEKGKKILLSLLTIPLLFVKTFYQSQKQQQQQKMKEWKQLKT